MKESLPGLLLCFAAGTLVAYLNYLMAKRAIRRSASAFTAVPVYRMILSVGLLAAVYFIAPRTGWSRTWMLVGAAVGLTIPSLPFSWLLMRAARDGEKKDEQKPEGGN